MATPGRLPMERRGQAWPPVRSLRSQDNLFIVESKGGAFTYTSPATDFPAYVDSLRNLLLKPATQGKRFLEYISDCDAVSIYDAEHREMGRLRRENFRHITVCAVTLDPFTELAAQVQHLPKIGIDAGETPVWAISVDDLRVYADLFDNPLIFLHFVEQRALAYHAKAIQSDDELDHLGLYLKHNRYSDYSEGLQAESGAKITFHGYRSDIDRYFRERLQDAPGVISPKQAMPSRLMELLNLLAARPRDGRAWVSGYVLDRSSEWRHGMAGCIRQELNDQPTSRVARPWSTSGDTRLTLFCWCASGAVRDASKAVDHACIVMLMADEPDRLLMELSYDEEKNLVDVHWCMLTQASLTEEKRARLGPGMETLRRTRVLTAKAAKKIGRNALCPCGSERKYKRCCLGRLQETHP
jgi:hypothetical protein